MIASDGHVYRDYEYGLFIYNIVESKSSAPVMERIDIDHPVDVIWSPEGDALLLRAVGIEGFPSPFYSSEPDTLIYDLTTQTLSTLQAGDPAVFYTDGYDAEFDVEGQTFYFSAMPPYAWLPDGRIVFQSGGIDCANDCASWNDLYIADRDGTNLQRLTVLAEQIAFSGVSIEDAVWSPVDERLYIKIGSNDSNNAHTLYSVDPDGNIRPELIDKAFGDLLPVQPVVSQGHNYVTVYKSGAGWSIQQLGGDSNAAVTIYQSEVFADFPTIDAFAPNGKLAAVNAGLVTQVIDLEKGVVTTTLDTGTVCGLRWLDDQIFIYQQVSNALLSLPTCPEETGDLWKVTVAEGDLINLTERFLKPVRLLLPD